MTKHNQHYAEQDKEQDFVHALASVTYLAVADKPRSGWGASLIVRRLDGGRLQSVVALPALTPAKRPATSCLSYDFAYTCGIHLIPTSTTGGRAMKCSSCLLIGLFALAFTANARIGETREQCQQRYGQPVTNYPGDSALAGCDVYVKDGIAISAFFVTNARKETRAGLVIYSRMRPDVEGVLLPPPEITSDEQTSLLGTVAGRWENYDTPSRFAEKPTKVLPGSPGNSLEPASGFARKPAKVIPSLQDGKSTKVIPLSTQPTLTEKQRDTARQTVQKAAEALYQPAFKFVICLPPSGHCPQRTEHLCLPRRKRSRHLFIRCYRTNHRMGRSCGFREGEGKATSQSHAAGLLSQHTDPLIP